MVALDFIARLEGEREFFTNDDKLTCSKGGLRYSLLFRLLQFLL